MSLLNEMLKNLHQRNQQQAQQQITKTMLNGVQVPPPKISFWTPLLKPYILSMIIMALIVLGYCSIGLVKTMHKKHLPARLFTKILPQTYNARATLQNVFVTHTATEIILQFTFDKIVQYQLHTNTERSQHTLNLTNVNFNNKLLAPVDFIKTFTTKTIGKDSQLLIDTTPGTEIKVMQDQTQKPIRLVLIFSNNTQPAVEPPKPAMIKTLAPLPPPKPEEVALTDYQDALSLIEHDYIEQAVPLLKKALTEDPSLVAARKDLVVLLMQDNEITEANNYIQAGLKLDPYAVALIELEAKLLLTKQQPEAALKTLQKISPAINEEPEYYALLASLKQQLGDAITAEKIYQQLLTIDSSNANWWVGMGVALESQDKKNEALRYYQRANAMGGLSPRVQMGIQERIAKLGK